MVVSSKLKDSTAAHLSPEFPTQTDDTQLHIPLRDTREATVNKVLDHIFIPRYSL